MAERVVREQYWLAKFKTWKRSASGFGEPGLPLEGRAYNSGQKIMQDLAAGTYLATHATGKEEE